LIGAWLGISYGTAVNWTKETESCSGDQKLTVAHVESAASNRNGGNRAPRTRQVHINEGCTVEQAAQAEGVSRRTAFNDLKRLETQDTYEEETEDTAHVPRQARDRHAYL
jgi:hypothetical protein